MATGDVAIRAVYAGAGESRTVGCAVVAGWYELVLRSVADVTSRASVTVELFE